jgi:hypothetical protein
VIQDSKPFAAFREYMDEQDQADNEPEPDGEPDAFEKLVAAFEAELLDTDGLDAIPELEPLIDGFLYLNSMARVIGPSGSMKSFVMLDFAGHIGAGRDWRGHRTAQGLVIYLVAEGGGGIRKRVRAWEQYHGRRMTGVQFLPRPVQATDDLGWAVLLEACKRRKPSLVIFDTQARITVGVEENSAKEMGLIVQKLEDLRAACNACVALVHHQGLNGEHGRGSTSVKGALQTELRVVKKGKGVHETRITVSSDKQKDDEEEPDLVFALEQVKLAGEAKPDGSPLTSVVLVPGEPPAEGGERSRASGPMKASGRVLAVLRMAAVPLTPHGIGDVLAKESGGPLKLRTIQNALKELAEQRLVEVAGMSGYAQLWQPVAEKLGSEAA